MRVCLGLLVLVLFAKSTLAYTSASKYLDQPPEWYKSEEAKAFASNILSWQATNGGWPKNTETTTKPATQPAEKLKATFDNSAGYFEFKFLAKMYQATTDEKYKTAIQRYVDFIISAQYPNGGWPQSYPPPDGYGRYITFNDGSMQRLMFTLRDVFTDDAYKFLGDETLNKARAAWDRGVDCMVKCQVKVDGKLTVWCAQHDEKDFSPKPARAFEPVSLSGAESLSVMNVLMHVENPSPEVVAAVDAAAEWFDRVRIKGIRIEDRPQPGTPKGFERFVVEDPSAPDLWARFYEMGTNRPIFMGRDSKVKYSLAEIDVERRTGYRWYGAFGAEKRLKEEYPAWKAKVAAAAAK